jgi:CDP-diacylglycerol--glycerol-3-phosphate 3-phosphatidyltransferase
MVSYVRARAEGMGIECKDGLMQRPERILLIGVSAILCGVFERYTGEFKVVIPGTQFPLFESITLFTFPIFILAILANWTAVQRLYSSKKALDALDEESRKSAQ